jgi:hypothetical protein
VVYKYNWPLLKKHSHLAKLTYPFHHFPLTHLSRILEIPNRKIRAGGKKKQIVAQHEVMHRPKIGAKEKIDQVFYHKAVQTSIS